MEDYKQKFIEYLENNELKFKDSGEKVQCQCLSPDHDDNSPSSFASFEDETETFFHCSSCGFHLNHVKFVEFLGGKIDKMQLFKSKMNKKFKEIKQERDILPTDIAKDKIYLPPKEDIFRQSYRGISPKTFEKVECYHAPLGTYYEKRLIFPLYNHKNELMGFDAVSTSKSITPKVLRSKNCKVTEFFGFENLFGKYETKLSDTVFICEGLFSALSFIELEYNGIFNFGVGGIEDKLESLYKSGIKKVVLCGDKDSEGFGLNSKMYHMLKDSFQTTFFKYPYNTDLKTDSNDCLKKNILQETINKSLEKFIY